jgi:hypothetical protein
VTPPRTVQTAAFLVPASGSGTRFVTEVADERLRCASVLKPLVFWTAAGLAPYAGAPDEWKRLARDAVTVSANGPTVQVWRTCGGGALLDALAVLTGVRLALERGGPRSFGRVLVTAGDVARGYACLAAAGDGAAGMVRGWMLDVPERQTFGVRPVVCDRLGVGAASVAVKCGWFCDADEQRIRTHAATLTATGLGVVGTVVLTALPVKGALCRAYAAAYRDGDEVLGAHEEHAGAVVRAATEGALGAALSLVG